VSHGLTKKGDKLPKPDVEKAGRVLAEHDVRSKGGSE
jgi:hypothetical protein